MANIIFKTEGFVHSDNSEYYKSDSSFFIEENFSSLKFEFFGEGKPLYFHVTDPEGVLRVQMLGKGEAKGTVLHEDESKTGIGTCPGKIKKGEWIITVYTFGARCNSRLGKVFFDVKVYEGDNTDIMSSGLVSWLDRDELESGRIFLRGFENADENKKSRWLKGDFHAHTCLSDGSSSPDELIEVGLNKKLDFFFITEHGILTPSFAEKNGIRVFPSYEVTTALGHFNLPGLKYLIDNYQGKGPDPEWSDIKKIMTDASNNGALISINHPLHHPWLWLYNDLPLSMIDSVEIISDPYAENSSDFNNRTIKLLDLIWDNGYRITAVGGSDTHTAYSESQLGQPVSKVYAKEGSLESLLAAVRNHNVSIFTDLDCTLEYSIGGEAVLPGTEIEKSGDLDLEICFDPLENRETLYLNIIENGQTVEEIKTFPDKKISVKRKWSADSAWIRCEVRDSENMIRAYCNPVYRSSSSLHRDLNHVQSGLSSETIETWGDVMDLMD